MELLGGRKATYPVGKAIVISVGGSSRRRRISAIT
jgi:hypothetical protein